MSRLKGKKIGFIGSGNMAEALARGVINAKLIKAEDVMGSDISKTIGWIQEQIKVPARIVRVMPNTPALIGEGAAGLVACKDAKEGDCETILELMQSVGVAKIFEKEEDLDAVTGLSGSGPAYVFRMMEAMIEGAKQSGLEEEKALNLTIQTVIGAGILAQKRLKDNIKPDKLREMVTSHKGTTEAGLNFMKEHNFFDVVRDAVKTATARSKELAKI
ncbi:pyrroline-5-carboxylate reductase 2 [Anaeramoeba ignava]|uniref:Pyrroline-5-carboxylate reductase 2 n=1 Tax=Anaeramoeba ignava TaxID=1746090 RepID=A0A9Q0LCX1_ANAIG|nr:pyrroline-5-carboxylate reductase 2 [Anaeramoeba ignava]